MKKEILITILCASLIVITPFNVVAREKTISNNIVEQPDVKEFINNYRVAVNEIFEEYSHIPMVFNLCKVLINFLDSLSLGLILFCIFVYVEIFVCLVLTFFFFAIGLGYLGAYLAYWGLIGAMFADSYCHNKKEFSYDLYLNKLSNIKSIINADLSNLNVLNNRIEDFIDCPCLQE